MSLYAYRSFAFRPDTLDLIETMNAIVADYQRQGFTLTVRQLYYQLVARAVIENTERSYKRVTGVVNDARLAGMMDWEAIEDRTREFITRSRWESPNEILHSVARQFHMDMWANQENRVFVIVEKEALAGVLQGVCKQRDIPLLAARGYPSVSVLREFAVDVLRPAMDNNQHCVILHLGDHDPSGIDMTRDLVDRLRIFCENDDLELKRIALNMDQIRDQKPPPNPAKTSDARFDGYAEKFGEESWELDALTPTYLANLVSLRASNYIDRRMWDERAEEIENIKKKLATVAEEFQS